MPNYRDLLIRHEKTLHALQYTELAETIQKSAKNVSKARRASNFVRSEGQQSIESETIDTRASEERLAEASRTTSLSQAAPTPLKMPVDDYRLAIIQDSQYMFQFDSRGPILKSNGFALGNEVSFSAADSQSLHHNTRTESHRIGSLENYSHAAAKGAPSFGELMGGIPAQRPGVNSTSAFDSLSIFALLDDTISTTTSLPVDSFSLKYRHSHLECNLKLQVQLPTQPHYLL